MKGFIFNDTITQNFTNTMKNTDNAPETREKKNED